MSKLEATHTGLYEGKEYPLKTKTQNQPIWHNRFEMWVEDQQKWIQVPPKAVQRYADTIKPIETKT